MLVLQPLFRLILAWRIGADWQYHASLLTELELVHNAHINRMNHLLPESV